MQHHQLKNQEKIQLKPPQKLPMLLNQPNPQQLNRQVSIKFRTFLL